MSYRIAVVEDDDLIRDMVRFNLEKSGHSVETFSSAEMILNQKIDALYDLIILDLVLPGISGQEFLELMRKKGDNTPVLMLTVKSDIPTRITALDSGADDYLTKPFNMDELQARVKALIRRSLGKRRLPSSQYLVINGYEVDSSTRMCSSNIGSVTLSEREMNLLLLLSQHSQETLSRADILEEVWGMDVAPTPRTVDNFIAKFRKLFEDDPENPKLFVSVRGKGYRYNG
jgi:two-component system alkaline phosphatase synthesis response regulator PhoP